MEIKVDGRPQTIYLTRIYWSIMLRLINIGLKCYSYYLFSFIKPEFVLNWKEKSKEIDAFKLGYVYQVLIKAMAAILYLLSYILIFTFHNPRFVLF